MKARSITRTYITLNVFNDFAYFGFFAIQFLLLEKILHEILPEGLLAGSDIFAVLMIVSQLIWQIWAEGPTGAFADLYGRTRAVTASFFCRAIGVGLILGTIIWVDIKSSSLIFVVVGFILVASQMLIATGEAFLEGSIEAWLRDEMEVVSPDDFERKVDQTFGLSAIAQNIAILTALTFFLGLWQVDFWQELKGEVLASVSIICFLIGGVIANSTAKKEQFVKGGIKNQNSRGIIDAIRDAFKALVGSEASEVRRLAIVLVLPFPCWILLAWIFSAFVKSANQSVGLPEQWLLWLGLSLGIARVLGAWWGNKRASLSFSDKLSTLFEKTGELFSLFEKTVVLNLLILFLGSILLVIITISTFSNQTLWLVGSLFVFLVALAKSSEEVVKLAKNRLLAVIVSDARDRATILSLISICQNTFAFTAIVLAGILIKLVSSHPGGNVNFMFFICGLVGLLSALFLRVGWNSKTLSPPNKT